MKTADPSPKLSLVAASRNDSHGGNLNARTQLFLDLFGLLCARHGLSAEVVLVEWNPPSDRPSLSSTLRAPAGVGVRVITVPAKLHRRLPHSSRLPFFQMIAKNVGIRRARGRFVLASNVDILFTPELVAWLTEAELRPGRLYRVDRLDSVAAPRGSSPEQGLAFARNHVIRINGRWGTLILPTPQRPRSLAVARAMMRSLRTRGSWMRRRMTPAKADGQGQGAITRSLILLDSVLRYNLPRLHTNAAGDFTLMAASDWHRLRAYPELPTYSLHLDGLLCQMAQAAGIRQKLLRRPKCIYHMEHSVGSGFTPGEGFDILRRRMASRGVPMIQFDKFLDWVVWMRRRKRPLRFNRSDWGLAGRELPEVMLRDQS